MILMSSVKYLIGNENIKNSPVAIYSDEVCAFLDEVSQTLLKSPQSRIHPDISALAFWARKANISKLKSEIQEGSDRLGRGLCFHITPSNIPINCIFSYFFSLLAGNANIVRLPSKEFAQVDFICEVFNQVLEKHPTIKERTAFIKYPADNSITEEFSKIADVRMIWGGDKTISSVKKLQTKPRCYDITFADRYSICIIDASKIECASEDEIKRLSENFYNDTYLMDQNACSSPQLILWANDTENARIRFWDVVYKTAKEKYVLQDASSVDKYTKLCEDSVNLDIIKSFAHKDNLLYRVEISQLSSNIEDLRGKCGYFYEYALKNFDELFAIINEKYQTITYFGIDPENLKKQIVENNLSGVDRIVPIGKAMDINVIWDGHDLVSELSRIISVI